MRVRRTCVDISFSVYLTLDDLRIPRWNLLNVSFDNLSPRNPTHDLMTSSFFLFHSFCQNSIGRGTIYAVIWSLYSYFVLTLSPSRAWPWAPLCVHTCLISLPRPDCPQLLPITSCVVTLTSSLIARSFPGFWGIVWRVFSSFPFSPSFVCSFLLSTPLSPYQGCYTVRVQRGACGWMWVSVLKRKSKNTEGDLRVILNAT